MSAPKKNRTSNFSCFSSIFKRLICSTNLPTYQDHDDHHQITIRPPLIHKLDPPQIVVNTNNNPQLVELKPGIVARLMGLDSIPERNTQNDESLFFRSKSLNSLQFFPDFNSNKALIFHRRSASTSSFSFRIDDGIDSSKVESHNNGGGLKQRNKKQGRREKTVEANLKGSEGRKRREKVGATSKKRFEEGYTSTSSRSGRFCGRENGLIRDHKYNSSQSLSRSHGVWRVLDGTALPLRRSVPKIRDEKCGLLLQNKGKLGRGKGVNNVGSIVSSKKRVYDNQKEESLSNNVDNEVSSDSMSRSPVSVLDHHHHHHLHLLLIDHTPSKEEESQVTPTSRRKPRPKKTSNQTQPQDISPEFLSKKSEQGSSRIEGRKLDNSYKMKKENEAEYFVGLLGQICRLAEEQIIKDPKWVAKCQGTKVHFVEELCLDFGGQILELLLDELMEELLTNN